MTVLPVQNLFYVPQPPAQLQKWINQGLGLQNFQPPHPPREKRAGAIMRGDDGNELPKVRFFYPTGYEVQPWQPPHPRREKWAALIEGDDGTESTKVRFFYPTGFEVQPWQPPHPRREKAGAILEGDDGSENPMPAGIDTSLPVPNAVQFFARSWTRQRYPGIKGRTEFAIFPNFYPFNEVQAVQPPHPRPERAGSIAFGDNGTENVFIPPAAPVTSFWGFYPELFQPSFRPTVRQRGAAASGESNFAIFNMVPWTQDQHWQPYHTRFAKAGGIMPIEPGIEFPYIFVAPPVIINWGFDPQPWQPQHIRWEHAGAIAKGDEGIELPKINWQNAGWQIQEPPPPHKPIEKRGAVLPKDDGNQFPLIRFLGYGFHVQPWQPPHRAPEKKFAAMATGDAGTYATKITFLPFGWPIQPWQPPHPRPERSAAFMPKDDGIENIYNFVPPPPPTTIVRDPDIPHEVWRKYKKRLERLEAARVAQERAEDRARAIKRKALRDLVLGITEQAHDVLIAAEEAGADIGASPLTANLNALVNAKNNRELEKLALQTERLVLTFHKYIKDMQDEEDDLEIILREIF